MTYPLPINRLTDRLTNCFIDCFYSLSRRHTGYTAWAFISTLLLLNMYVFLRPSVNKILFSDGGVSGEQRLINVTGTGSGKGNPVQHVVFLKVHKAASTTVMNIIARYGLSRNLTFMIHRYLNGISQKESMSPNSILPPVQNTTYDILCNHIIFNKPVLGRYFPSDSKYIAILREPFEQMVSAFMYYKDHYPQTYITQIPGNNPISTYLKDHWKYEPHNLLHSFTYNRMSLDLGYNTQNIRNASATAAAEFIKQLEREFDLIMIVEYFDESVVLLRRLLGWELKNMLYVSANVHQKRKMRFSPTDRYRHKTIAWLDNAIYSHFYKRLWHKIFKEGPEFFDEVHTFQSVRQLVQAFCLQMSNTEKYMTVNQSRWNPEFIVTIEDCAFFTMRELPLVNLLRLRHQQQLKDHETKL